MNRLEAVYILISLIAMVSEWNKLRSFDGSQEKAFEELCCQLAGAEQIEGGSQFTRKGPQDGRGSWRSLTITAMGSMHECSGASATLPQQLRRIRSIGKR